ncbi:MAG: hypothetical protein KAH30_01255 [Caldisericia bacterium]|nr:hypothetical protein [Caldisericia bacterium]
MILIPIRTQSKIVPDTSQGIWVAVKEFATTKAWLIPKQRNPIPTNMNALGSIVEYNNQIGYIIN